MYFLRMRITLYKQKYNFSITRLSYQCFKKPIELEGESFVILTKDGNGLNIKPSDLIVASLSEKQQRIFDLNRKEPLIVDKDATKRGIVKSQLTNNKRVTQYNIRGKKVKTSPSISVASKRTGISHTISVAGQGAMNIQQLGLPAFW